MNINTNLHAEYSLSEQDLANNLVINYGIDCRMDEAKNTEPI